MTIIELSLDGNQYCAKIGDDLQSGEAGFGDTPADALCALADAIKETDLCKE